MFARVDLSSSEFDQCLSSLAWISRTQTGTRGHAGRCRKLAVESLVHVRRHVSCCLSVRCIVSVRPGGNVETLKSPVGDGAWAPALVYKWAVKLGAVCSRLARLASAEAAMHLLRYQTSHPVEACGSALTVAGAIVQVALESILRSCLDVSTTASARHPIRHGGLGATRLSDRMPPDLHWPRKPHPGSARFPSTAESPLLHPRSRLHHDHTQTFRIGTSVPRRCCSSGRPPRAPCGGGRQHGRCC